MKTALYHFLLLSCLAFTGCERAAPPVVETTAPEVILPAEVKELTPTEATQWLSSHADAQIIDLRMPEERTRDGQIDGSKNYDYLQSVTVEQLAALDHQKPVFIYCTLGGRSSRTSVEMHRLGFQQIVVLKGGLNAWLNEKKPVLK